VDALHTRGETRLATRAQRFAVPTISTLIQMLRDENLTRSYRYTLPGSNLTLVQYFENKLKEALELYVILSQPTRFDLGEARIVALDLDEVAPKGSSSADRQTVILFMLSYYLLAGKFFHSLDDLELVPKPYQEYHRKRIEELRGSWKRMEIDEAHRFLLNDGAKDLVISILGLLNRESRKWKISIRLSTQDITDVPETLIEFLTSLYVMGVSAPKKAKYIADRFGMPGAAVDAMTSITKPGPHGSTMLCWHNTVPSDLLDHGTTWCVSVWSAGCPTWMSSA